jgi:hypothetical protein
MVHDTMIQKQSQVKKAKNKKKPKIYEDPPAWRTQTARDVPKPTGV